MDDIDVRSKEAVSLGNQNEQYSRKNNIKILNMKEKANETEEELISSVTSLFQTKGVSLQPSKIMAIHRIPGKPDSPKPILVKLTNNNEKTKIMIHRSAFKAMGHRLIDDVTKLNAQLIQSLTEHKDISQAWYFNGFVYGKSTSNKRLKFNIYDDVNAIIKKSTS